MNVRFGSEAAIGIVVVLNPVIGHRIKGSELLKC